MLDVSAWLANAHMYFLACTSAYAVFVRGFFDATQAYLGGATLGHTERHAVTQLLHTLLTNHLGPAETDANPLPHANGTHATTNGVHTSDDSDEDMEPTVDDNSLATVRNGEAVTGGATSNGYLDLVNVAWVRGGGKGGDGAWRPMLQPCIWPHGISAASLAEHTLVSVLRDVAPVAMAAALALCSGDAAAARDAGLAAWLPAPQLARLLQSAAPAAQPVHAVSEVAAQAQLALWSALPVLCERSLPGVDTQLRVLCLQQLASKTKVRSLLVCTLQKVTDAYPCSVLLACMRIEPCPLHACAVLPFVVCRLWLQSRKRERLSTSC